MNTEKMCPSIPVFEYSHCTPTKGQKNSSGNGRDEKGCSSIGFLHYKKNPKPKTKQEKKIISISNKRRKSSISMSAKLS